jgi:hypothetical protein
MGTKKGSERQTEELAQAREEFRDLGALLNKHFWEGEEISAELLQGLRKSIKKLRTISDEDFGPIPDIDQIEKWIAWRKKESSKIPSFLPIAPPGPWFGIPPAREFHQPSTRSLSGFEFHREFSETPIIDSGCNDPDQFEHFLTHGFASDNPHPCPLLFNEYTKYGQLSRQIFSSGKEWGGDFEFLPDASWIVVDGSANTSTSLTGQFVTEIPINHEGMFWLEVRSKTFGSGATHFTFSGTQLASIHATHRCVTELPVPPNPPFINVIQDSLPLWVFEWGSSVRFPDFVGPGAHFQTREIVQNMAIRGPGTVRVRESINYLGRVEDGFGCASLDGVFGLFECLEWTLRRRNHPVQQGVIRW